MFVSAPGAQKSGAANSWHFGTCRGSDTKLDSVCTLHRHALTVTEMPVSLKNVLDKTGSVLNVIASWFCEYTFLTFHALQGKVHTKPSCSKCKSKGCLEGKHACGWVASCTSCCFFTQHCCYSKEWLSGRLWLFGLDDLADIFPKMNEVRLLLQTADTICSQWQNSSFQVKIRILEKLESVMSLTASWHLTLFLMRLAAMFTTVIFFDVVIMKCANI